MTSVTNLNAGPYLKPPSASASYMLSTFPGANARAPSRSLSNSDLANVGSPSADPTVAEAWIVGVCPNRSDDSRHTVSLT